MNSVALRVYHVWPCNTYGACCALDEAKESPGATDRRWRTSWLAG